MNLILGQQYMVELSNEAAYWLDFVGAPLECQGLIGTHIQDESGESLTPPLLGIPEQALIQFLSLTTKEKAWWIPINILISL